MGTMRHCGCAWLRACLGVFLLLGAKSSYAGYGDETAERLKTAQRIAPIISEGLGETISPYNGAVRWRWVDVSIPGSSRLKVELARVSDMTLNPFPLVAAGTGLDIPVVSSLVPTSWTGGWTSTPPTGYSAAGTGTQFPGTLYSQGFRLEIDGQSETLINRSNDPKMVNPGMAGTFPYGTKSGWVFQIVTAGDGTQSLMGYSPQGLRYTFNKLIRVPYSTITHPYAMVKPGIPDWLVTDQQRLYVTRVDDLFGNHVDYNWNSTQLSEIRGTDVNGEVRLIQINYAAAPDPQNPNSTVTSVVANGRTWQYDTGLSTGIRKVTYPDGSTLKFSTTTPADKYVYDPILQQYPVDDIGSCAKAQRITPNNSQTRTFTYPSGVQVAYTFIFMRFGRTNVPFTCRSYVAGAYEYNNQTISPFEDSWALTQRQVTGPGIVTGTQSYAYAGLNLGYQPGTNSLDPGVDEPALPNYRTTTITREDGTRSVKTYGRDWAVSDGQLLTDAVYDAASALKRQTQTTFIAPADVAAQPFPASLGVLTVPRSDPLQPKNVPIRQTVITQDGVTFTGYTNSYDSLARATSIAKSSSLGYAKTDNTDYYNDTSHWVLGQISRHYNVESTLVDVRNQYDPNTALVTDIFAFEKLKTHLTYNTDGTLANIRDGLNHTTMFSSWKRGIPRNIQHADLTNVSAAVDDNGWIQSVTDENGYQTGYGYDAMGRVSSITYPNEPTLTYNTKTLSFRPLTSSDSIPAGYQAGQWRLWEQVGNHVTATYYDSLWQPTLVNNYDSGNQSATLQATRLEYDSRGRKTFESYPASVQIPGSTGTLSTYDALDRVTQVKQDSELASPITTKTDYLTGFQVQTTNPRGFVSTAGYLVYDEPSYDLLAWSRQPENKDVTITRNNFGMPTSIAQSDHAAPTTKVTRTYVYNLNMELCKTIEPEVGSTVMSYDAASNLAWSATGGVYPDPANCNTTEAYSGGRRVNRGYDARNRITSLTFPDGRGNQSWQYTPDGLASASTVDNDGAGLGQVSQTYTYNHRRLLTGESTTQPGYTWNIANAYDTNGNLSSQQYPNSLTVNYNPNALGQATAVASTAGKSYASAVSYYPNGGIKQFTYGNGIVHTMTQNARQLPANGTDVGTINFGFTYDANGNPTAIADNQRGSTYNRSMTYDGQDRLTVATSGMFGGLDGSHRFTYDALDNLKSWKLFGVKDYANYVYDAASNRLTQIQNTSGAVLVTLGYDVQGNLASKNSQGYGFDYGNRLRSATNQESYRYDAQGRRVSQTNTSNVSILSLYAMSGQLMYTKDLRRNEDLTYIYLSGSQVARIREALAVPATPTLSAPATSASGNYTVLWSTVAAATSYVLEESTNGGAWTPLYNGAGTSTSVSGRSLGSSYGYRVKACNAQGCSAYSAISTVQVMAPPSGVPTLTAPATNTTGSYTVSWTTVSGATSYTVDESYSVDGISNGSWTQIYNGSGTSTNLSGKAAGFYTYRAKACNAAGCSGYSAAVRTEVRAPVPLPPATAPSLTVPAISSNGNYTVSWTTVATADRYELQESLNGGGWTLAYNGNATSAAFTGRADGNYAYQVRACNAGGCGPYSTTGTITVSTIVVPAVPTLSGNARVTDTGSGVKTAWTVRWTNVGAQSYELRRDGVTVYTGSGNVWTKTESGVPAASTFIVRACNGINCSAWSAPLTITP